MSLLLLLLSFVAVALSQNIVENGDMESLTAGIPSEWKCSKCVNAVTDAAHGGANALLVTGRYVLKTPSHL